MRRIGLAVLAELDAAGIGFWALGAYFDARL